MEIFINFPAPQQNPGSAHTQVTQAVELVEKAEMLQDVQDENSARIVLERGDDELVPLETISAIAKVLQVSLDNMVYLQYYQQRALRA